jgi:hypothetical protein
MAKSTKAGSDDRSKVALLSPFELKDELIKAAGGGAVARPDARVVLLPGRGFGTLHPSGRVSLANLNESDYVQIGRAIRHLLAEYVDRYNAESGKKLDKHRVL